MEYPVFKQENYPQELGTGQGYSIAKYGCALCSVASICNWYGRTVSPVDVNTALISVGGFQSNGTVGMDGTQNKTLLVWGKIAQLYGEILLEQNVAYPTTPADMGMIDAYLLHNKPVIVGVSFVHDSRAQTPSHYVVLYAKNDDGSYQCFDPWFGDRTSFNARYAVNGMSVAQSILQVVCYSGPAPQTQPSQAPIASHQQEAVTPQDTATQQAQDNWNLYLQEVEIVKQKNDRIQELEQSNKQLTDANTKLQNEISQTKQLNSTLAEQIRKNESEDSAAIEEGLRAQDQLKQQQEIVNTVSGVLRTKPTMKGILSEIDSLFMKLRFAKSSEPKQKLPQPTFEKVDPLSIFGIKGVSK